MSHPTADGAPAGSPARRLITTGLMLFALFFGAGNLIFPPVLGASAGPGLPAVMAGFLATGVLLPLVAIIAVSTSGEGIVGLARRVGRGFGLVMPAAVYLAIGPLYAIARVTTVSYELTARPLLELAGIPVGPWALPVHALVFLAVSSLIALRPSRLADRIGRWLTPALLLLIIVLCAVAISAGRVVDRAPEPAYATAPVAQGLTQGYFTMDVLAATVFGIVVLNALRGQGISDQRRIVAYTSGAGCLAAALLAGVYVGLAMIGARTPGPVNDGTALLRAAADDGLGRAGVVIFGAIVLLACLTTAVGLLSAWAGYASTLLARTSFEGQLLGAAGVTFILSNLGLAAIIQIISPVTLLLYPMTITLITVTIVDVVAPGHLRAAYRWGVAVSGLLGLVSALADVGVAAPSQALARTGMWDDATGWILPTVVAVLVGLAWDIHRGRWTTPADDKSDAEEEITHAVASHLTQEASAP